MKFFLFLSCLIFTACSSSVQTVRKTTMLPNKVVAHRGAFKNTGLPENSLAALQAAINMKSGGSEFDIHMTRDEVLVINHDADFLSIPIETSTYADLQQKTLFNGEKIPTLEAFIKEGICQHYTKLIAEIKTSTISKERSLQLATKVVEMVKKFGAQDWVTYIAFDYDVCKKIKTLDPHAPVQYLNGNKSAKELKADGIDADYQYGVFTKNTSWIADAKKTGIIVNAWTVNDATVMDDLLAQGIDMITTNEPELLLKKLRIK
ncbi:MAG: glycerophosphodiester phosphodiesterase [Niabella sp.]